MADVSLKKKAHEMLQKGKLDGALRAFKLLLKEDPEEASIHNSTGDVLLKMDRQEEALRQFVEAAELYLKDGLHTVALSVSRKALRIDADYSDAHLAMARCYDEQGKPEQAKHSLMKFLKSGPEKTDPRVLEALQMLMRIDPEEDKWVIKLAKLAYLCKDEIALDQCVMKAAEKNLRQHPKMVKMLERLRAESGAPEPEPEPEEAGETVEEAEPVPETAEQEAGSDNPREYMQDLDEEDLEGEVLIPEGRQESSVRRRKRIGEYLVTDGLLNASDVLKALEVQKTGQNDARLGDVLVDMGLVSKKQVREALSKQISDMKKRLISSPEDPLGFVELGNLLLDVGDFYGSVEAYLKAATIYRSSGRERMVFELLEGVLDICPESLAAARELARIRKSLGQEGQARALYRLAVAYLLNDSPHEALAALEASLDAKPDFEMARQLFDGIRPGLADAENYADIATILADIDNMFDSGSAKALADLIREFQDGIDQHVSQDDYNTHYDLGIAYHEMGLLREAVSELEKVLDSPEHRLKAREMLGRCYFRMDRYDEAEEQFRKGITLASDDHGAMVGFHIQLAKVYTVTGRKHQAEQELEAARNIDPVLARMQDTLE
ncbi:MAG: tetratricopeptide repeat protein [Candidatus Fermentibacteraceae bacterium]